MGSVTAFIQVCGLSIIVTKVTKVYSGSVVFEKFRVRKFGLDADTVRDKFSKKYIIKIKLWNTNVYFLITPRKNIFVNY